MVAHNATVQEMMRQSPTKRRSQTSRGPAKIEPTADMALEKEVYANGTRAPSPACSQPILARLRNASAGMWASNSALNKARSATPASLGRRSETPASALRKPYCRGDMPPPLRYPSPARLPTARTLFGPPPTRLETENFFRSIEQQLDLQITDV